MRQLTLPNKFVKAPLPSLPTATNCWLPPIFNTAAPGAISILASTAELEEATLEREEAINEDEAITANEEFKDELFALEAILLVTAKDELLDTASALEKLRAIAEELALLLDAPLAILDALLCPVINH